MAARIVYGLRGHGRTVRWLGAVNARTRTPVRATVAVAMLVLLLARLLPLVALAAATSAIILVVFALVNLALLRVQAGEERPPDGVPRYPSWIPAAGALLCLAFVALRAWALLHG